MTFIWLQMLWLLLLVPAMVVAYFYLLFRKKRVALRYANLAIVKQAIGAGGRWRRHIPPALFLIAIALMLIAVARPEAIVTLASNRATVILSMDVSGSMRANDIEPSRIEASQAAAKKFIQDQPRDVAVGIVAFAATAFLVQAPTFNRDELITAINRFELQRGTAVGSGILVALQTIFPTEEIDLGQPGPRDVQQQQQPQGAGAALGGQGVPEKKPPPMPVPPGTYQSAIIILLTDGQTTTGPDPIEAARLAADHGVRVYTVGFGSSAGDVVGFAGRFMRAELDEGSLKQIADMTKGQYFAASSEEDLDKIYNALNTQLIKEKKLTEITAFFAAAAAFFAMASASLSFMWFNRVF